ncbi:MAG TPA: molybdopterin dinucleotide binding domain-containing protein [Longimicrobiales bacterium]|nr:molybdopterin dinucleotide binding domain-containing protein [Longimicrobiales bacterium]
MSNGVERRTFLKVLGVSGAGAALSGCSTGSAEKLIPYVVPPEEIVPGMSTWYRTTCRECPAGCGMNIRTREGRAVKAEGNPLSPIAHGKLCARGQASLHGLYNPDRIPQALVRAGRGWDKLTWDQAERQLAEALLAHRGRSVFLTHSYPGSMDLLVDDFCAALGITRVKYETFGQEPVRAAHRMLFGADAMPVHDFSQADVVLSFGADFMETWGSPIDYAYTWVQGHAYSRGRRGKLVWVGPHQTLTGLNADEWLAVVPGTEHIAALAIARLIVDAGASAGGAAATLANVNVDTAAQQCGIGRAQLEALAAEFARAGRSLAVGPGIGATHNAATAVAMAVAILNSVAGNYGRTVTLARREEPVTGAASYADLQALIPRLRGGAVGALLVHGPNPVYSLPEGEAFAEALGSVPFVASFSPFLDETTERARLLLPDHHFLESWGDFVPRTGLTTLVQPVMTPVFSTKQTGDVLLSTAARAGAALRNAAPTYYDYVRGRWQREGLITGGGDFDEGWRAALQAGFVVSGAAIAPAAAGATAATPAAAGAAAVTTPGPAAAASPAPAPGTGVAPVINAQGMPALAALPAEFAGAGAADSLHLVIYPSYRFYDGRLADRPWLQDLPDPISKYAWESCVEINPRTAERLGIDNGHIVTVRTAQGEVRLPAFPYPGVREDTVAIQLGQGHTAFGPYAKGRGVNALRLLAPLADPLSGALLYLQTRATIAHTGDWERPVQAGLRLDDAGRHIAQRLSLEDARHKDELRGLALLPAGAVPAGAATGTGAQPDAEAHLGTDPQPGHTPEPGAAAASAQAGAGSDVHEESGVGGGHGAEDVHPNDAVVRSLQGSGGWAPATIDASPQGWPPPGTHYGEYSETQPRWGMAIDLDRCIGCTACMTACQAENNIAIVGPDNIRKGRSLHWIRIERYWHGEHHEDGVSFLPMLCQHCSNAPCEPVCPVYAAYHTPDGLNAQIYNRCVGTRYCANNCPYKVRSLNYYTAEWPEPLNWQLNPDVTVREKGVMEKCTFCVQRIRDAQNVARREDRGVMDGEIVPACAQTCPGNAIVFGNTKDPNSLLRRVMESGRGYRVLEAINTQSAITYLKRVSLGEESAAASGGH